jgi:saccharopine dehydrogenase (NAD+, L-lysine-forming)
MDSKVLFIRREIYTNEYRTPLVPKHIPHLLAAGFRIYIQSSMTRVFSDKEYIDAGAIVTMKEWYDPQFTNALIIGIKELDNIDKLKKHTHLYFSHSFKGQIGSEEILRAFFMNDSLLYDFEYLTDSIGQRLIAFGFHAGLVGGALGLLQYSGNIGSLTPWKSLDSMIASIPKIGYLKIAIVGANGRTGNGVQSLLKLLNIPYDTFVRGDNMSQLLTYDIVYNTIALDESYTDVWFDYTTVFAKPITIVDISCDYTRTNNPIQLYTAATTWSNPVHTVGNAHIIAIENLPSLLPVESSDHFSARLCELIDFKNDCWNRAVSIFLKKYSEL